MQRFLACMSELLTSTSSRVVRTPTAPPQNEATMGSTAANCPGRCIFLMKSAYVVPAPGVASSDLAPDQGDSICVARGWNLGAQSLSEIQTRADKGSPAPPSPILTSSTGASRPPKMMIADTEVR